MGVKSANVSLLKFIDTVLLKLEPGSTLKDGSRLVIKLTERQYLTRKVRAEASASFDDCQRLISSCPGEFKG
jgi:uncharacterized protein YdeI (YjbR/CyaY-like superfamily)